MTKLSPSQKMIDFIRWLAKKFGLYEKEEEKEKIENIFELLDRTIEKYTNRA